MEEKREPLSEMAIERKIQILRNKHMDSEVIALVKSDYEYGLTDDEIGLYLNKSYDIEQMKVLSKCLHKGVSEELLTLLKDSRMAAPKMQTALDYYEKGVPIDAIREVVQKDDTAVNMRRMFDVVLEKLNKAKEQMPQDLEYVKSLVAQMDEVVAKINHQNERYDALNKKLSEIETSKDDEEVRERLVKENQDKDALINSQQNELNKASSTIARLRDDIEKKDKEMKRMGDRIESLEDKIISVATENKKEAESKAVVTLLSISPLITSLLGFAIAYVSDDEIRRKVECLELEKIEIDEKISEIDAAIAQMEHYMEEGIERELTFDEQAMNAAEDEIIARGNVMKAQARFILAEFLSNPQATTKLSEEMLLKDKEPSVE